MVESQAASDYVIGPMRVLTMCEMAFFFVSSKPTPFADLDKVLDPLLDSLHAAKRQANLTEPGPDVTRYYKVAPGARSGEPDLYVMEVGIPVLPGTLPTGAAQVKTLPPYHCAGLLIWGNLSHIAEAHVALMQAIQAAGLERTSECREWNYYVGHSGWESPDNLIGLYMEIG